MAKLYTVFVDADGEIFTLWDHMCKKNENGETIPAVQIKGKWPVKNIGVGSTQNDIELDELTQALIEEHWQLKYRKH